MHTFSVVLLAVLAGSASAAVGDWQQCGGQSWSGDTQCQPNSGCVKINDHYSQCQPGAAPQPQEPSPSPEQPSPEPEQPSPGTPSNGAPGPGRDLISGYYWIRGVAAPNYHKYMQSNPLYSASPAVLGSYTTAGQFKITSDGQLAQLISAAGASPEQFLYANVNSTLVINGKSLAVSFSESKNSYGKFAWNGDGLVWSAEGVKRPNAAAWYVCQGQKMYINLGDYLYGTPSGCADQTIHYYNDKRAND